MAKDEVMACLKDQANIEPSFSQLVWQKLEEQNADFFRAYNLRVQLKNQVVLFNQMLQQQMQMPLASLPKPFSMSDLNALDIPGQIANDLGDFSGLPYPGDADAGSSAAAAAAVAAKAAAPAGGPPDRQLLGMSAADCGVGPGMQNAAGGGGSGGSGGDGGGSGQQQVDGMPAGFTLADLGQLDMVMDMLR
ncbi:hypothetical protein OEZ85_010200 [Tetradesmus obliquus]|uniref:Uncharacterized protein n=1 Tax=Tetradesmus obliquus TaxID=3088 RepID=A0ABY8TLK7_TETOB|nr:hypothetical protein OEZ85_010200 [Tetradesmus obliquus]